METSYSEAGTAIIDMSDDDYREFLEHEVRRRIGVSLDEFVRRVNSGEIDWEDPEAFSLAGLVGVGGHGPIATDSSDDHRRARSIAQDFADRLNALLNRTVTDARLSLLAPAPERFLIACFRGTRTVPFALNGTSLRLYVEHGVDMVDGREHTAFYTYRLQSGDDRGSWLVRWDYICERPVRYPYTLGHVHARADFITGMPTKPLEKLHVATARVALELVLHHLITEWGVQTKSPNWETILERSLADFESRRTAP